MQRPRAADPVHPPSPPRPRKQTPATKSVHLCLCAAAFLSIVSPRLPSLIPSSSSLPNFSPPKAGSHSTFCQLVPSQKEPTPIPRSTAADTAPRVTRQHKTMAALPFSTRRPFSSPCFILCFLLGFVAGLFPFAHRHLHLDLDLRHLPLADPPPAAPTQRALVRPPPTTTLIVVTPTRARPLQAYYLHRLAHTLRLVPQPLLWLVVDRGAATRETAALLRGCGLMYRHLPSQSHRDAPGARRTRPEHPAARGLRQRNAALDHIEHHRIHGLVYFADEDNVYSLDLFDQLRGIR